MSQNPSDPSLAHERYCIEKMHGVTIGLDCLTRYSDRVRDDVSGLNMLAILLERRRLLASSRAALIAAQKFLAGKDDKNFDVVHLNLGR